MGRRVQSSHLLLKFFPVLTPPRVTEILPAYPEADLPFVQSFDLGFG
jgi:hypothetical protein